jgi:uncharacterized membrane protein
MPTSHFQTTQHFEWDAPWSFGLLLGCALLLGGWSLFQIVREANIAQSRWSVLFILLRSIVAGVLLWMILGPTSVLVRKETHPKTMAVYIDTSSSMQIQDQPDPVADRRWELAADEATDPLAAADQAVLFASAMRQEAARLTGLVERQASNDERQESADKWEELAGKCANRLEEVLNGSMTTEQQDLLQELNRSLKTDLQPLLRTTDWVATSDPGDREERLNRLGETSDQFSIRCRILAEGLAGGPLQGNGSPTKRPLPMAQTRLARVVPALKRGVGRWLRDSNDKYRLRLSQFSDKVATLPVESWEAGLPSTVSATSDSQAVRRTDLAELLKQIRDETGKEEIAAAVIITDGRQTTESPEDPRDLVTQLRVPLYIVPIGRGEMQRDVILHHLHAPPSVIQNDKILIEGLVTAYRCAGESCEVQLLEGGRIVESRQMAFSNDQEDQRFRFEIPTEKVGRREFKLQIPSLSDEHSAENNTGALGVDVADAVLRLLVADGRARWEHQYLVNLLKRQERVEFDQLKFAPHPAGTGKRERTHQFPQTVEEWSDYRVVVLGDVGPRQLNKESQEALREFVVQRGGCLILIAGQNDMPQSFQGEPLEELLPVATSSGFALARSGYRVELTIEGKTADVMRLSDDLVSTEAIWREMSASLPIYFLSSYHKPKPASQVLLNALPIDASEASGEAPAFLSWQQVGAGRVVYISSPSTYQLRMRNGDKFHHRFWGQLVRWIASNSALTGSKRVKLMADKSHYNQGDAARLTVELSDEQGRPVSNADPRLDVIQTGEVRSNVSLTPDPKVPGRFLGQFAADGAGRYSLRVRGSEVEQLLAAERYVDPVQIEIAFEPGLDREIIDPRSDRPLLEQLAEQTGGLVLEPTALSELSRALSLEPRTVETSQRAPLWDRWWCLWVILGSLTLEWIIRKRVGLA